MALIKCPECGAEISDTAEVCIKCGYSLKSNVQKGKEIKEGLKGLNTYASPKKKKTCLILNLFPFITTLFFTWGGFTENFVLMSIGLVSFFLNGAVYFYTGHIKKGLIYTITTGFMCVGSISTFFKLIFGKFRDASGFPVIY